MGNGPYDEAFSNMHSILNPSSEETPESCELTLWVFETYKAKFDDLQKMSNKKFGKELKKLIYKAIDEALKY